MGDMPCHCGNFGIVGHRCIVCFSALRAQVKDLTNVLIAEQMQAAELTDDYNRAILLMNVGLGVVGMSNPERLSEQGKRLRERLAETEAALERIKKAAQAFMFVSTAMSDYAIDVQKHEDAESDLCEALDATDAEHRGEALRADRERVWREGFEAGAMASPVNDIPNPYAKPEPDEGGGS